jgi:hypothetical protein
LLQEKFFGSFASVDLRQVAASLFQTGSILQGLVPPRRTFPSVRQTPRDNLVCPRCSQAPLKKPVVWEIGRAPNDRKRDTSSHTRTVQRGVRRHE